MRALAALTLLVSPAAADIVVVDASGGGAFTTIGDALAATSGEDLVLVTNGIYPGFDVVGRSATVVGAGLGTRTGQVRLLDLEAGDRVFLSGFHAVGPPWTAGLDAERMGTALVVRDSLGAVRVHDCKFDGALSGPSFSQLLDFEAVRVIRSPNVAFVDAEGSGGWADAGLFLDASSVSLADSEWSGGRHRTASGAAAACAQSPGSAFSIPAADSSVRTERASTAARATEASPARTGGTASPSSSGPVSSLTFTRPNCCSDREAAGSCSYYGTPYPCDGATGLPVSPASVQPTIVADPRRSADHPVRVQEGGTLAVELSGVPGDSATLILSQRGDFTPAPALGGVQLAGVGPPGPEPDRVIELGVLPAASWVVPVPVPLEDPDFRNRSWFAQVVFHDAQQVQWYGPGRFLSIEDDEQLDDAAYFCFAGEVVGSTCGRCPCTNILSPGNWGGCRNGQGTSCRLLASGSPSLAADTLRFDVTGAGIDTAALLVSADNRLPAQGSCTAGTGIANGAAMDGLRCVGGALLRHGVRAIDGAGSSTNPWGAGSAGPPGGSWFTRVSPSARRGTSRSSIATASSRDAGPV